MFDYIDAQPSTPNICPLMYEARSDAKKATAKATSCGVPNLPSAMRLILSSILLPSASYNSLNRSVLIIPGATALTRMFMEDNSLAADFVIL